MTTAAGAQGPEHQDYDEDNDDDDDDDDDDILMRLTVLRMTKVVIMRTLRRIVYRKEHWIFYFVCLMEMMTMMMTMMLTMMMTMMMRG